MSPGARWAGRRQLLTAGLALVALVLVAATGTQLRARGAPPAANVVAPDPTPAPPSPITPSAAAAAPAPSRPSAVPPTSRPRSRPPTPRPASSAAPLSATIDATVDALGASLGAGGFSVAAFDPSTGRRYQHGAAGGMPEASVAKVEILIGLLLQHQDAGTALSARQRALATTMIENSDNTAADDLWRDLGQQAGLLATGRRLGLTATVPVYEDVIHVWGLTRTSAADQITVLAALLGPSGGLTATSRDFVLGLMRNVRSDQRWGVSAAGTGGPLATKIGWLAIPADAGRYLVNSVGIVTVGGQPLLLAVLTQHEPSVDAGIEVTETMARAAAGAVR